MEKLINIKGNNKHNLWCQRDLRNVCEEGINVGWFDENKTQKVGKGAKINFCEDKWCGPISLMYKFYIV